MTRDESHWLFRLTPEEWLKAAENERARARAAMVGGERRKGLFEARRAAGMACNAFLALSYEERYGRSYMDHLHALGADTTAPAGVREAALRLLEKPPSGESVLVALRGLSSPADLVPADAAETIEAYARELILAAAGPRH